MKKIVLERRAHGWVIWLFNIPGMPEDVELPLPFMREAPLAMVAADMRKRFPAAAVFVYENDRLTEVARVA